MSLLSSALRASSRTAVRLVAAGALAVGIVATAPATTDTAHAATARRTAHKISTAVSVASHQKGDPYRYGASGPNAFDCSGLTYYSFRRAGFGGIPRTSSAQSHYAKHIKRRNMRRGDLVFFYGSGGVYHVGVFVGFSHGRRLILHAPYSGARVRVERIWTNRWFPGTLRYRR